MLKWCFVSQSSGCLNTQNRAKLFLKANLGEWKCSKTTGTNKVC